VIAQEFEKDWRITRKEGHRMGLMERCMSSGSRDGSDRVMAIDAIMAIGEERGGVGGEEWAPRLMLTRVNNKGQESEVALGMFSTGGCPEHRRVVVLVCNGRVSKRPSG